MFCQIGLSFLWYYGLQERIIRYWHRSFVGHTLSKGFPIRDNLALISTTLNHRLTETAGPSRWFKVWIKRGITCVNTFSTRIWLTKEQSMVMHLCDLWCAHDDNDTTQQLLSWKVHTGSKQIFQAKRLQFALYVYCGVYSHNPKMILVIKWPGKVN